MKRFIVATAMAMAACTSPAYAWGNIGLPNPVTVVLHAVGGYAIAAIADRAGHGDKGVALATVVGIAKEVSDINFNVPDALGWSAGAWLYKLGKDHPEWCWRDPNAADYWYVEQQPCPLDGVAKP